MMKPLEQLMLENQDVLFRLKNRNDIHRIAKDYWNFNVPPPPEMYCQVMEYISMHPEHFRGLTPQ